jgi:hypothetical protein
MMTKAVQQATNSYARHSGPRWLPIADGNSDMTMNRCTEEYRQHTGILVDKESVQNSLGTCSASAALGPC